MEKLTMAINTDPDALSKMAQELLRLSKTLQEAPRRVRSQLNSSRWDDPVRKNFEQLLSDLERNARSMSQSADEGARMLKAKEQQLRTYLGR